MPSVEVMRSRFEDSIMSLSDSANLVAAYYSSLKRTWRRVLDHPTSKLTPISSSSTIAYMNDKFWNTAATIPVQASVLLISSQHDARTPQKYADQQLAVLNRTNKTLLTPNYSMRASGARRSTGFTRTRSLRAWKRSWSTCRTVGTFPSSTSPTVSAVPPSYTVTAT